MCICPKKPNYANSYFLRAEKKVEYASKSNFNDGETTFSESEDEAHQYPVTVIVHIRECCVCGESFSEFGGYAKFRHLKKLPLPTNYEKVKKAELPLHKPIDHYR